MPTPEKLPTTVTHFDELPSKARIDVRSLKILLGITSVATYQRRRADGSIPEPDGGHNTWLKSTVEQVLEEYSKSDQAVEQSVGRAQ